MKNTQTAAAKAAATYNKKLSAVAKAEKPLARPASSPTALPVLPPIGAVPVSVYDTLPATRLTPHFSLREFVISGTAVRHGIDNTPPPDAVKRLEALCRNVLEPLRQRFGAIRITSGYRCESVNRLVGGARTSQHMRGEAADINVSGREQGERMYEYIRTRLDYDQLILEQRRKTGTRWIHVSYRADGHNRKDARHNTVV